MAEGTKSSKKNKKKRSKKQQETTSSGGNILDHVLEPAVPVPDPVTDLKQQIEEAKNEKDFKKAQKLREQLWTLQDAVASGRDVIPITSQGHPPIDQVIAGNDTAGSNDGDPTIKALKKLEKKLKTIEELKVKRDKGIKLENNQTQKIATEDQVRDEIEIIKQILTN